MGPLHLKQESEPWRSEDETAHTVTLSDFYISRYGLTQTEYQAVMGENPSSFSGDDFPVDSVSWLDAVAYPDWWSTCPMAVFTFLDSYDFTGKTVIPFCAHGTSGLAASVRDIRAALPGITVLDAVGVQRPGMDIPLSTARATVETWLTGLEY